MISNTIYRVAPDGTATVVWRTHTEQPAASAYVRTLLDPAPDIDTAIRYVTVETAAPPGPSDLGDGPSRIRRWIRPAHRPTAGTRRPRHRAYVWTWNHTAVPAGWHPCPDAVFLRGRLVRVELIASTHPWRDDDPVLQHWDLTSHPADDALLRRDDLVRAHGGRADQRLREIWSRP